MVALLVAVIAVAAVVFVRGLAGRHAAALEVPSEPAARRDIAVTIEATGTVEPIDLVEIKSKASGQVIRMPVEVGSQVKAGDLLAQIDPRDVRNQYDQAFAALRAVEAKVTISEAQKKRADDLFAQQVTTADEHESAALDFANAQASLVKARTDLDLAKQRLDDATVRAPITGTVLEQLATAGQVISSATSSASGGTTLLRMADLSRIRLRALVSETDIGSVRPAQSATVTVDAFPQRTFEGAVEKIEPQAVVQQSVTMFPVLISISNERGLLLPGMNGQVAMLVDRRDNVLAIPLDAVRSVRELPPAAVALGMNPDSVGAQVQRQVAARMRERAARGGFGGDSSRTGSRPAGGAGVGVDAAGARAPGMRRGGFGADSSFRARRTGAGGSGGYAGGQGGWTARGGSSGGPGAAGAGSAGAGVPAGTASGSFAGSAGGGARGSRAQVVFVRTGRGFEPRVVRLGISDFDYSEVLDGLKEGEEVALLSVAELQAKRKQDQSRMRERMGGGVPGVPSAGGGGRAPGGR
jgi:HlyD family secretion protein